MKHETQGEPMGSQSEAGNDTDAALNGSPKVAKFKAEGRYFIGADGNLCLNLGATPEIFKGPMVWSGEGKSASPIVVNVPPLKVGGRTFIGAFNPYCPAEKVAEAIDLPTGESVKATVALARAVERKAAKGTGGGKRTAQSF